MSKIPDSGYGIIMRAAMRSNAVSCGAKAVYAYLCSFSGYDGVCYPSQRLMAHDLNLNADTVRKYLRELADNRYITVNRSRSENGKFERYEYSINHNHTELTGHGGTGTGGTGHGWTGTGETGTNINNINNNKYNNNSFNINSDNSDGTCFSETSYDEYRAIEAQFMKQYMGKGGSCDE